MSHTVPGCGSRRTASGARSGRRYRRADGAHRPRRPPPVPSTEESSLPSLSDAPDGPGDPQDGAVAASGGTPARRPRTRLLLLLALVVLVLDLGTKLLVVATVERGADIRLLGGALYLTHTRNTGAAFSFAEGFTVVFTLIAVAVAVVIVRTARRLFATGWAVALGLVLGGAVGNLVDRVFREPGFLRGGVVDFISVFAPDGEFYPVFNVADSAIVCGGVLGVVLALRGVEFDGTRGTGGDAPARD
ncbi:signal peptidase II [Geodermatophilus poikilotrophus]|uniref:Lipoprotein signal peptidase n=1 Tax=Geodermatophilus poikilotrophus TaxID=1333667 RepID=A0A1I0B7B3_9ACTN|nr:signal peptidase II [Geodermatophilus poikilotrophus]SET02401.1 signal peptidase II [Geodermatophilus poikilotrophus]